MYYSEVFLASIYIKCYHEKPKNNSNSMKNNQISNYKIEKKYGFTKIVTIAQSAIVGT